MTTNQEFEDEQENWIGLTTTTSLANYIPSKPYTCGEYNHPSSNNYYVNDKDNVMTVQTPSIPLSVAAAAAVGQTRTLSHFPGKTWCIAENTRRQISHQSTTCLSHYPMNSNNRLRSVSTSYSLRTSRKEEEEEEKSMFRLQYEAVFSNTPQMNVDKNPDGHGDDDATRLYSSTNETIERNMNSGNAYTISHISAKDLREKLHSEEPLNSLSTEDLEREDGSCASSKGNLTILILIST